MRRYSIKASSILGHHEVSLDKSDPGKRFMALVRCLLGAKALIENDPVMNELVLVSISAWFSIPYQLPGSTSNGCAITLFWSANLSQVLAWEEESGYWFLYDQIFGDAISTRRFMQIQFSDQP